MSTPITKCLRHVWKSLESLVKCQFQMYIKYKISLMEQRSLWIAHHKFITSWIPHVCHIIDIMFAIVFQTEQLQVAAFINGLLWISRCKLFSLWPIYCMYVAFYYKWSSNFDTFVLTLARVGGVDGYCNRFVCLSVGKIPANLHKL